MGLMHILLAKHLRARRVIAADLLPVRCENGRHLGADEVIDCSATDLLQQVKELTSGEGAEVVIAGPATVSAIELGIACASRGGTVIQFMGTEPGSTLPLATFDYYFREIRLIPSYSCGPVETRAARDLIAARVVTAKHLVTHRFPLVEANEAYRVAARDLASIKTLVTFPS